MQMNLFNPQDNTNGDAITTPISQVKMKASVIK